MNMLPIHTPQADRVEAEAPLLGADVGSDVELPGGVSIDVAIKAGHPQAGLSGLAIVGRIDLGNGVSKSRSPSSCTGVRMSLNSR